MRKIKMSSFWVSLLISKKENIRILFFKSNPAKGKRKIIQALGTWIVQLVFPIIDAISVMLEFNLWLTQSLLDKYIQNTLLLICQYSLIFPIINSWDSQEISYGESNFWQNKQLSHFQNQWCGNIGGSAL